MSALKRLIRIAGFANDSSRRIEECVEDITVRTGPFIVGSLGQSREAVDSCETRDDVLDESLEGLPQRGPQALSSGRP